LEGLFVPEVGLVREHPAAGVCWLANDNLLVAHALKGFAPPLARRIWETLKGYGGPFPRPLLALFDRRVSVPPFPVQEFEEVCRVGRWVVKRQKDGEGLIGDWQEYADLLCVASISSAKRGRGEEARILAGKAARMWDGVGLLDKAAISSGRYATFKLALLLWAAKEAGLHLPFAQKVEQKIWGMQAQNGGITTDYDGRGRPVGTQNAETTALVLLAFRQKRGNPLTVLP